MSYTYDARNLQLTITNDIIGKTVGYTYDERGRKVALTYPDGETITYTRDSRGQVARLASDRPGPGGEPPPSVDYAYNPDGSLASMDYGFGMHVERLYDRAGRLVDLRYTKPDGTVISDFAYTHDEAGNILSKTTDFGLVQYGYDALDRLVLADYDWKADETFAYDAVGNRTADAGHPVWHYDAANQLLAYGAGPHDPAGQTPPTVPAFTFAYDANGSTVSNTYPAAGTTDQYGYSFDNRMNEVWRNGELVARYFYDHLSQRTRKDLFTDGSPTGTTWFVYGHEGLLVEYDTAGALIRKYAWQPDRPWGVDPVCLCALGDDRYYFITDHLFTPQQMLDETFNSVWQADWQSFGRLETAIESAPSNLRFPGQYRDAESSLMYNCNRYYSVEAGRYLAQDPVRAPNFPPLYHYAYSNPPRFFDQLGLKAGDICEDIIIRRKDIELSDGIEYGHWWVQIGFIYDEDSRSYGWWPDRQVGFYDTFAGVPGVLNGVGPVFGGSAFRDPHHYDTEGTFYGKGGIASSDRCKCWSCEDAKECLIKFAHSYLGEWSYWRSCHTFQEEMIEKCCLEVHK